jgi:pimeloyl-ACP methyl ester carboxylesterase
MPQAKHHDLTVNGVRLHLTEQGAGPLVLLCHGWPELAYSWRHQLPALAAAGYRAVAPDMRGFGHSDAPADINAYTLLHTTGDMVALVAALGETEAVIVGHDWGAPVAWTAAMIRPDIFRAVVAMSVPHRARGPVAPLAGLRAMGIETFYWQYFQSPGVAEAEFEADIPASLRRILFSGSGDAPPGRTLELLLPKGGGFLDLTLEPETLPAWLTADDLATMAASYRHSGFRGGLNYYRNIDRNWELLAPFTGAKIRQPALFIAGTRDVVIAGMMGKQSLADLPKHVLDLRGTLLIEGGGHWIQQERPAEVNAALIEFLNAL